MQDHHVVLNRSLDRIVYSGSAPDHAPEDKHSFQISSHPTREILFVSEGTCKFMLNNNIYQAEPGTIFLIDKWERHPFGYQPCDRDLVHLWFHFYPSEGRCDVFRVGEQGKYKLEEYIYLPNDLYKLILRRWDQFKNVKNRKESILQDIMKLPLELLLNEIRLDNRWKSFFGREENLKGIIEAVKEHIQAQNGRGCSLQELAYYTGFNPFYLSHKFKEHCHYTIGNYISRVRMEYTAHARAQGMTQKEISSELGFSSPAAFWIWQKKHDREIESVRKQLNLTDRDTADDPGHN